MPVALVTGASRGLGRQIAVTLSENGYSVSINYLSSSAETAHFLETTGRNSVALRADVGDSSQVSSIAEGIKKEFGRLDVIINNAGIAKDRLLLKQTELEWDSIIRTNLTGCFNVIRTLSPLMIESGGGHIVNISSHSGLKGQTGQAAYSASKAALLGLTISAARELSEYNIRVNAVLPGYMMTEMGKVAKKASERVKNVSLLKRLSQPREVADFILQLIKTENVSGQIFNLDSRIL